MAVRNALTLGFFVLVLTVAGALGREGGRRLSGPWLPDDTWLAMGLGGQRLLVVPSRRLVAVLLAPIRGLGDDFPGRDWLRAVLEPLYESR